MNTYMYLVSQNCYHTYKYTIIETQKSSIVSKPLRLCIYDLKRFNSGNKNNKKSNFNVCCVAFEHRIL